MDPRDRFSLAADEYARYRPDYPDAVVLACAEYAGLAPGARIVDIGSGTGISSRLFARNGYRVTGIEPNAEMRERARAAGGGPEYRAGDASATGLPDHGADLVTCAQALHWLDMDEAIREWRRILVPEGACAAIWNLRLDGGWQAEYEELLGKWSREYDVARKSVRSSRGRDAWVRESGRCRDIAEREFPNSQALDWEGLRGRARSSSYVVHGVDDLAGFERELREVFDRNEEGGRVEFRYRTYVLLWRIVAGLGSPGPALSAGLRWTREPDVGR